MLISNLNEYCQKNKYPNPIFEFKSTGQDHQPKWFCVIKILDLEFVTELPSETKMKAKEKAVKCVLDYFQEESANFNKNPFVISTDFREIYLIDLENVPLFNKKLSNDYLYIGFHNSMNNSLLKYTDWYKGVTPLNLDLRFWYTCTTSDISNEINNSNKLLYIIEGGVKDVVDHYMSMFTWPLSLYLKTNKSIETIHIISSDHSGYCTKACLEKCFEFNEIKNISIKNSSKI